MKKNESKYQKTIVIPITKEMWQLLRTISFEQEISMSELARVSLAEVIKKYKPDVDI